MRRLVEDLSDAAELFFACRVPDLQLEEALLNLNKLGSELHSDCHIMFSVKIAHRQSSHNIRLSDT